jgi:hypothetical protein
VKRDIPDDQLPPDQPEAAEGLAEVRGWLDDDDPFFAYVDQAVAARARDRPRAYADGRRSSPWWDR